MEVYLMWRNVVTVSKEVNWRFAVEVHYLLWRHVVTVSKETVEESDGGGCFCVEACG